VGSAILALATIPATVVHGATWYLNINNTGGNHSGESWLNSFRTWSEATTLNEDLVFGDTILVADGTYYTDHEIVNGQIVVGIDRNATHVWPYRIKVECGYAGDGPDPTAYDPDVYVVTFSGELGDPTNTDNAQSIMKAGENPYDPFDPQVGDPNNWDWEHRFSGATFRGVYADNVNSGLGALFIDNPSNYHPEFYSFPRVDNCRFEFNRSVLDAGQGGGAALKVREVGGNPLSLADHCMFWQCDFVDNESIAAGGAVVVVTGSTHTRCSFVACRFEDNHSTGTGAHEGCGGAIQLTQLGTFQFGTSETEIVNCVFRDNSATIGGGALAIKEHEDLYPTTIRVVNSLFVGNSTTMVPEPPAPNSAGGGAIYNSGGEFTLASCTLTGNTSAQDGGAWYESTGEGEMEHHNVILVNSIVHGNTDGAGAASNQIHIPNPNTHVDSFTIDHCLIEGGVTGITGGYPVIYTNNLPGTADPLFVDPDNGLYAILAASPCVDAGINASVPCDRFDLDLDDADCAPANIEPVPYDIRGVTTEYLTARIVDGDEDTVAIVDIGAYEMQSPCAADVDGDGTVRFDDILLILNAWGPCPSPPLECPGDIDGNTIVGFSDLLIVLNTWGPCGAPFGQAPESIADCLEKYGNDINKLTKCIEAMILANTP